MKLIKYFILLVSIAFATTHLGKVNLGKTSLATAVAPSPPEDSVGAEWNTTGDPIGGGIGYSEIFSSGDDTVYTVAQLKSALSGAGDGDVIFVMDTVELDFAGENWIAIPAGVTIASGRGRTLSDTTSWGALFYISDFDGKQLFITDGAKTRISGLRLRGAYSAWDGNCGVLTDTFNWNPAAQNMLYVGDDSAQVDNCEIWGWQGAPITCIGGNWAQIHHNYFHHGDHTYKGYGSSNENASSVEYYGNYWDAFYWPGMRDGGTNSRAAKAKTYFNIFGEHSFSNVVYFHDDEAESTMVDSFWNNTFRQEDNDDRGVSAISFASCGFRDTVYVHNCWTWDDSSDAFAKVGGASTKFVISHLTDGTTPPDGLAPLLPTAGIWSNADSGTVPLTCSLSAHTSTDNGTITWAEWDFGDSLQADNYVRTTDYTDTVVHVFNQVGKYYVQVQVWDDDGIPDKGYKTINVKPVDSDEHWLSAWIYDWYHYNYKDTCYKQILINDWVCWEKDVAGNSANEHVLVNVTDTVDAHEGDSVTVRFRYYCKNSQSGHQYFYMTVDDVALYGCNVLNGNFESGTWSYTNDWSYSDGTWECNRNGSTISLSESDLKNRGERGILIGGSISLTGGDWAEIYQKVAVE